MRNSIEPKDYIIVTKKPSYTVHGDIVDVNEVIDAREGTDKTFWLVSKDDDFKRRYSVESAPNWVMRIYKELVG